MLIGQATMAQRWEGGATPYTLTPTVLPKVTYLYTNVSDGVVNVHVQATSNDKQNN